MAVIKSVGAAVRRIGVDTGGTFTDFVSLRGNRLVLHKCRSTPEDPSQAILEGIDQLSTEGAAFEVVHGSTVATNAVLERKGARVALVATAGFEDVIYIGRQTRPELYNLFVPPRRAIVEPGLVFGVPERMDATGHVLEAVDRETVDKLATRLVHRGAEIVAVCLLHSYVNPTHERQVAERFRRAGLCVCASHEVLPEYREFERWSTTAINAYVMPLIDRYLSTLQQRLKGSPVHIMQSNGGSISASAARAQPVRMLLSGPAAGVVGARAVAGAAGFRRILSFDMGGTSTDVSLIDDAIAMTTDSCIGGFPVRLPMIDIHSVGAGGGSIAFKDSGGALRVGPRSAGAKPGPACYGTGKELTVTDANLLLGRLDPEYFLGGRMSLDVERARETARALAAEFKITVPELAEGVVRVANANMERAMRVVSVSRGHDPREFALLAFGGAGGMHACEIAERLEIPRIIVPRYAGVLSALGMLLADVTKDYSASVLCGSGSISSAELVRRFKAPVETAKRDLIREGFGTTQQVIERLLDVRYAGQSYEITLPYSKAYRREFDRRHQRLYGYSDAGRPTEIVNLRVKASGITDKPDLPHSRERVARPQASSVRPARFNGRVQPTAFYRWDDLAAGARARGPAVVTGGEATAVIPPGFILRADRFGNLIIRRNHES
jgi:N-methylhydantoinase A/oxoprolinase/acetone carboxylase beta subunit